ncbi:MAG: adenylate/guanylate cyclase domain-containing protein, partial [Myxococcota bacterium]
MVAIVRLASGLFLALYVFFHLMTHTAGIFSLEALGVAHQYLMPLWTTAVGTYALAIAASLHAGTVLWRLYQRGSLKMPARELSQLLLGLAIPMLLVGHVVSAVALREAYGMRIDYRADLLLVFVLEPALIGVRTAVVLVVWIHACIGLRTWLSIKPLWARWAMWCRAIAWLLPALSLAGFYSAGLEVRRAALAEPKLVEEVLRNAHASTEVFVIINDLAARFTTACIALYAGVLMARGWRKYRQRRAAHARLYMGRSAALDCAPGMTVLDALRAAEIPHAAVCGGSGRCSTCRVHIDSGLEHLPPPGPQEAKVLERLAAPRNIRLACQLRPQADIAISPLLPASASAADAWARIHRSEEREIAVLFADLRGFTTFAEQRLPYDVVYVLNRYRSAMATAIEEAGGVVNEFIGDGIMALFGLTSDATDGCQRALRAAAAMREELEQLNRSLAHDLPQPLRIGIGIHVGNVIVGQMNYERLRGITVVGDVVNTASRLEGMTKEFKAGLVISDEVAQRLG